ncbi:MAG: hypothetical protein Q6367_001520 [Candidatus Freyarchaeota archaeon]
MAPADTGGRRKNFAVYFTDYVELGCGVFSGVPSFIDMDYVNIVLAGVQAAMMNLGFCYVSEDTIADILKPFLGLFGLKLSPYAAIGLEVAGLASMLPQADQFYKEHIWPIAKLAIGASLMGGVTPVISSALMNTAAISGINMAEQAFINRVWGDPTFEGVSVDFAPLLEYLPLFGGQYDYLGNYITHYVYGMW